MNKKDNEIREKILKGMELTYQKLIQTKKQRNLDLVVFEKGKVRRLSPKDY